MSIEFLNDVSGTASGNKGPYEYKSQKLAAKGLRILPKKIRWVATPGPTPQEIAREEQEQQMELKVSFCPYLCILVMTYDSFILYCCCPPISGKVSVSV